eukprot:3116327-Alexandrium_andersonii.AAC.1
MPLRRPPCPCSGARGIQKPRRKVSARTLRCSLPGQTTFASMSSGRKAALALPGGGSASSMRTRRGWKITPSR